MRWSFSAPNVPPSLLEPICSWTVASRRHCATRLVSDRATGCCEAAQRDIVRAWSSREHDDMRRMNLLFQKRLRILRPSDENLVNPIIRNQQQLIAFDRPHHHLTDRVGTEQRKLPPRTTHFESGTERLQRTNNVRFDRAGTQARYADPLGPRLLRTTDMKLVLKTRCHSSSGSSSGLPEVITPTLFITISTRPKRFRAASASSVNAESTPTSQHTPIDSPPAASIS